MDIFFLIGNMTSTCNHRLPGELLSLCYELLSHNTEEPYDSLFYEKKIINDEQT